MPWIKKSCCDKLTSVRRRLKQRRPLTARESKELDEYFKIGLTYTSNALEGNSLTLTETKVLLEDGLTVGGKPIRDCFGSHQHGKAYELYAFLGSFHRSQSSHSKQSAVCTSCFTVALTQRRRENTGMNR